MKSLKKLRAKKAREKRVLAAKNQQRTLPRVQSLNVGPAWEREYFVRPVMPARENLAGNSGFRPRTAAPDETHYYPPPAWRRLLDPPADVPQDFRDPQPVSPVTDEARSMTAVAEAPETTDKKLPVLKFTSERRWGVELEVNAFNGLSRNEGGRRPEGIDYVAMLVNRNCTEGCDLRDWENTHGNDGWVVKPDSSCGMEICTPVYKGWSGLRKLCEVGYALGVDPRVKVDKRCSVHVHVEVADLSQEEIGAVIAHWFKVEPVFMDAMAPERKRNRYTQFMGMTSLLQHDTKITPADLVKRVGNVKYYSLNTNQMQRHGRKTIEFRTVEGAGVKDAYLLKNWVRLLVHFVETARRKPFPGPFVEGDQWSSFCWLDPKDVLSFLGFGVDRPEYELSPGMLQTRNWFIARLQHYMAKDLTEDGPRYHAYRELQDILGTLKARGEEIVPERHLSPADLKPALFDEATAA